MIYYKNSISVPNVIKKRVTVSDFSDGLGSGKDGGLKNLSNAKYIFNFDVSSGALSAGVGLKEYKINGKPFALEDGVFPIKLYYYKRYDYANFKDDDRVLCYASNGFIYCLKLFVENSCFTKTQIQFNSIPTAIEYKYNDENVLLMSSQEDELYVFNGDDVVKVDDAPKISSMCVHNERIFATEGNGSTSLWFSDDFNPLNWYISLDEAGFIDFQDERGALLKVISFLDYVYVFREFGISRLSAFGLQEDFSVSNLHFKVGKIYGDSVTDCGEHVYFVSTDGIYRFNGVDAVKILECYDEFLIGVDNSDCQGVYDNQKLYFNLKMKIDGNEEKVVIVYNLETKTSYVLRGAKISWLCPLKNSQKTLLAVYNNGEKVATVVDGYGKLFNKPLKKVWQSNVTDFSIPSKKRLYKVSAITKGDIKLEVLCDGKISKYDIKRSCQDVKPFVKGEEFAMKIISYDNDPKIIRPTLYFSYCKEDLW